MNRRLLAVFLICVVIVVVISVHYTRKQHSPDFLVYGVVGQVHESPWEHYFELSFEIRNNGTAKATNVQGSASFEENGRLRTEQWYFARADKAAEKVLEEGEQGLCRALFWEAPAMSSKIFIITVLCDEGALREFDVTIP